MFYKTPAVFQKLRGFLLQSRADSFITGVSLICLQYPGNQKIRIRETKDITLEAAPQQIEDRQYEATLRQQGCTNIMKVAVTFDGKRLWAKTEK